MMAILYMDRHYAFEIYCTLSIYDETNIAENTQNRIINKNADKFVLQPKCYYPILDSRNIKTKPI